MKTHIDFFVSLVTSLVLLLGGNAAYANVAGHVQFVNGVVQLTDPAGQTHGLKKGEAINEGDTLTSAKGASAQIRMQDGGFVAVRADTQLKFDSFKFSGKQDGTEQSFFSLLKGGFRAVTGLIGQLNKSSYQITTPVATIGIRGTDHETFLVAPGSELAAVAPPGAYNKVNIGETYLATDKGTVFVLPNQMGFAGAKDQMPQLQPINTNLFTVAPGPAPQAKGDKQENKEEGTVRESAVVDNTAQEQAAAPAPAAVAPGNTVTPNIIQVPVTTTGGTTLTGGGGTPLTGSPTYAAQNGYGYEALGVDALGGWINPWDSNLPATSYLLDASNNLFEVVGGINPGKVAGGVAKDTYKAADSSVYMGRWEGGTYTSSTTLIPVAMGVTSMQWMLSANPPVGYVQTLGGTTNYSLTAATHPTDKLGNVGTLTAATLTADFTNQMVNLSLALAFSTADPNFISTHNKAFAVTTPGGISIAGETVWGVGTVACTGANCDAGGYTADIWARFAANAADKVGIPYNIIGNTTDLVQGVALVTAATAPSPVAPAGTVAPYVQTDVAGAFATTSSDYFNPFAELNTTIATPADINNALPNPSFTDRYAGKDPASYVTNTLSGTTTVGAAATTIPATGISFGRYNSTQSTKLVVGTTTCCAAGTYTSPAGVYAHWITGPAVDPVYLPEVLLATNATYTLAGGTAPTGSLSGTLALSSASLAVDFSLQLVSFNLALSNGWSAGTAGTPLEFMYWNNAKTGFRATTVARPGWGPLTASSGAGPISGDVVGQLTGSGLNGALLSYVLVGGSDQISGVAAFTGAAQSTVTPYRLAGVSAADPNPPATQFPGGVYPVGGVVPIPVILGGYNNSASVTTDGPGNLTGFRSDGSYVSGLYNISKGAAVATGLGTDSISGISWGRWDGSSFTSTNAVTAAPGIVNTGSAHWIASPTLVGPVTLPVTGTFNYVLAGGTAPTDSLGGTGTLNSASLVANFTAQTVTVGINVTTTNAGNLIASAANLPIEQKSFFNAATAGAINGGGVPGSMTVTCGAGCTGTPQGQLGGVFAGSGGLGAAVLYGFAAGANNTTIVNGVAAFHR
jgi:hypothetical protein